MVPALLQFAGGLAILLLCAELLITITKTLALRWRLSPLFVALLLVALGTTLPEATVTILSIIENDPGLALGNIVGSNISNITLVFGLAVILTSPRIGTVKTPRNTIAMLVLALLFLSLRWMQVTFQYQGIILISVTAMIFCYQYYLAVQGRNREDKKSHTRAKSASRTRPRFRYPMWTTIPLALVALSGLAAGGWLATGAIQELAVIWQLTTTSLGLTLVATATSLPELVTILVAGLKGEDKITVGTLIGANIYNLGLISGILSLSTPQNQVSFSEQLFLLISMLLFTGVILFWQGRRVPRQLGGLFILLFLLFVFQVFAF